LGAAAVLTLPSLISHRKETGREALRRVVFVQGALGLVLAVIAAVALGAGVAGAAAAVKESGALVWVSRLISRVTVLALGAVIFIPLLIRLGGLKAAAETRERSERIFFSLFELQTAVGFLCLVLLVWDLVCELVINPLLTG
jgi:hypothetical protein